MMGSIAEALALLLQVTSTAAQAMANAQTICVMIQKAQQENRTVFTQQEWQQITSIDDQARQLLVDQITAALKK
jgi:uncharacterized protein YydD (DUF2326 family)